MMPIVKYYLTNLAILIGVTFIFAITAKLSLQISYGETGVTPVWPAAGFSLAMILLIQNTLKAYKIPILIGLIIGAFLGDFQPHREHGPLIESINASSAVVGMLLQSYAGMWALKYLAGTYDLFENIRSVLIFFLFSAMAACLLNAIFGVGSLLATGTVPASAAGYIFFTWWLSDAVGVVTITPAIMAWDKYREKMSLNFILKIITTILLISAFGYFIFLLQTPLAYLLIPVVIVVCFYFDERFSTIIGLIISLFAIYGAVTGYGHFQGVTVVNDSLMLLQSYVSVIFLTLLIMHVLLNDRQSAYRKLQLLNEQLERRVQQRTRDLSISNQELEVEKNKAITLLAELKASQTHLVQVEKMASIGVLTAGVAHEMNNPVNFVLANTKSLQADIDNLITVLDAYSELTPQSNLKEKLSEIKTLKDSIDIGYTVKEIKELLEAIYAGAKRIANIVKDLQIFARLEEADIKTVNIHDNLDVTLGVIKNSYEGRIEIKKEYGNEHKVECYPGELNQVFQHILLNAFQAIEDKGKVTIKTQTQGDKMLISFEDTGSGMDEQVQSHIFEPFYTTKDVGKGSGLGLSVSLGIINAHHGTITVNSRPNVGTTFTITLPLKQA